MILMQNTYSILAIILRLRNSRLRDELSQFLVGARRPRDLAGPQHGGHEELVRIAGVALARLTVVVHAKT